jgi:hypothetical protein
MGITPEQKQHLVTKAMKDEEFRDALRRDPGAAIRAEFQMTLPPGDTLHVIDPGATDLILIIPAYPADWPSGLSVAELEQRLSQEGGGLKEKQQQMYPRVFAKAWRDASFRDALLQDPAAALQQELGITLPADVSIRVEAEDAHTQYIVLPHLLSDLELSDEQLEQVAGGEGLVAMAVSMVAITAVATGISTAITFTDW